MANPLYQKHIISINDLSRDDLNLVLATAAKLKANPQPELLKHKVIASCFFEASTRTFEICESILRQQEKLRERIDETLSEKIVQKCRNMNGEYIWPWILPFSAAGMKHTGIQYQ